MHTSLCVRCERRNACACPFEFFASSVHSPLRSRLRVASERPHNAFKQMSEPTGSTATKCQEATMQSIESKSFAIQRRGEKRRLFSNISHWSEALLLLLVSALPAHGQFGASLAGSVLDPSGASIPGATVTLTNPATQGTQLSITNETGAYHFNELAPGQYSLAVTAPGFKANNITVLGLYRHIHFAGGRIAVAVEVCLQVDMN